MLKRTRMLLLLVIAAATSACTVNAPRYDTNPLAVMALKEARLTPVKVLDFHKQVDATQDVDALTLRGSAYKSPYGTFTAYLRAALADDLDRAGLLDEQSGITIEGVLLRNVLDASGFSIGFAEIETRLIVRNDGQVVYDAVKSVRREWPSNFVGAVAIPRAMENYPFAVRKLLGEFYADPLLLAALRKQ